MIRTQPLYNAWVTWNDKTLEYTAETAGKSDAWRCAPGATEEGVLTKDEAAELEWHWGEYQEAPIRYFLPHGRAWHDKPEDVANGKVIFPPSTYPKEYVNDGVAFVNDYESDICLMMGPNQQGKSYVMTAWSGFRILKCDPEWHTFKNHGIICPEWQGPRHWVIASYAWDNVTTIWQRIKHLFPNSELGKFAERDIALLGGGTKILNCMDSKSSIRFLSYTQQQSHYEGFSCDGAGLDEQAERQKVIGIMRGMTTGTGIKQISMALTGHVMKDRPDTGATGWIKREIYDSHMHGEQNALGMKVGVYHLSADSTPDAIVTKKTKGQLFRTWADPTVPRTEDQANEGIARYWGGWQSGSGAMLSEWRREVHVIPPLWDDKTIPLDATLYRSLDHGESAPTACIWAAVLPAKNKFTDYSFACIYRLFYETNQRPAVSAPEIIRMSGNERIRIGTEIDEQASASYDVFQEVERRERYIYSIMDSRSAAYQKDGVPIGALYQRYGLAMGSAPGGRIHSTGANKGQIEHLRDWLAIDGTKKHVITGELGAPRLYFFDIPCIRPCIDEIEGWARSDTDPNRPKTGCPDHSISTLMYWASSQPQPSDMPTRDYEDLKNEKRDEADRYSLTGAILRGA